MNYPVPGDHINFSTTQNMANWVRPWRKSGGLLSVCSAPRSHCPFFLSFACRHTYEADSRVSLGLCASP